MICSKVKFPKTPNITLNIFYRITSEYFFEIRFYPLSGLVPNPETSKSQKHMYPMSIFCSI